MDNMLEMYLYETNTLMEQLDELLIEAEKNATFTTNDVNEIFRIMHTIKGSSAMMEFSTLMEIAHHIEDLFFYIRENGMDALDESHKNDLFNLMFQSTDALRIEVEKIENDEPLSTNIDHIIANINSFLEKISSSGDKSSTDSSKDEKVETEMPVADGEAIALINQELAGCPESSLRYFIRIHFEEGSGMENLRAFMVITSLREIDLHFEHYPNDVETNSDTSETIVEKGFFIAVANEEDLERALQAIKLQNSIHSYEVIENAAAKPAEKASSSQSGPMTAAESTNSAPAVSSAPTANNAPAANSAPAANNAPAASASAHNGAPVKQSLISVNLSKLDSLVAIVGEIVITESMVTSSPDLQNLKLDNFTKSARQLRKLTDDLQDIAMSLRMVPLSGTFQKMNRIVRDMKKKLNKDVRLTLVGENTEVDKTVVDSIGDPIMHIVRNSMDHGVEATAEERIAAGKNPQAEIVLSAAHTGSEVIISISDDGQGMNPDKILAKAERNGILTKPASDYSKKEILSLLLLPGFSTNEEVTEFSGRGVGMDVVKKNVEAVGGTISITSETGKGSCTTLKIPLTMAITDGMEVSVGKSLFTIPIANIRQSFKPQKEEVILDANGNEIIKCLDAFYPIIRIHELYNIETEVTNIEDGILIWVETADKSYCLFVDELLGEQQVVVKPLSPFLGNFNIKSSGIGGCTILGDGNISLILDISNLYAATQQY
ncbi:chemotaxis protein CheA [Lachnospiraceae bacterium WCA-9-b2]|jgi:two-component system chemotaxis sensor kinase CheA|uniref:Chemotaxis protein CheA n=4 Tax=Sporofaciens musculi TaxID=2681861 RepID=A0A7X3SHC6_9FIRM|nr:chemotaxis protein CheA [Sporofaciens musculi]MXP73946.1 chemotaxis protein CheA [Sporofaciens musculi]